jgi:hypothetical protein
MSDKNTKKRLFKSMSYREVQLANSQCRIELSKHDQEWLKKSGFKNVGWEQVIALYQEIEKLKIENAHLDNLSLGELFLEADRIGNKYLTKEEISENNRKLAEANNYINEQIDQYFPDIEDEIIDFSRKSKRKNKIKS